MVESSLFFYFFFNEITTFLWDLQRDFYGYFTAKISFRAERSFIAKSGNIIAKPINIEASSRRRPGSMGCLTRLIRLS
jgi:hypothetical protein